jgi:tRNA pseudouridine55 synthase
LISPFVGVVLLDKAEGESSFSALGALKRHFNTRRVGHTGTLDPMATGLMISLVGPATRCARFFSSLDKTYVADVTFGSETDTDDRTGETVKTAPVPSMEDASAAVLGFLGDIIQVPPAYSAIHVDGRRAYQRARAGEAVEMPARSVSIRKIICEIIDAQTLRLTVTCSTGTYIRSLARDIGRASGGAAHLSALRRTSVGPFNVAEVAVSGESGHLALELGPSLLRLNGFCELPVDAGVASTMWNGGRVETPAASDAAEGWILANLGSVPVSIGRWEDNLFRYEIVFPEPENSDD